MAITKFLLFVLTATLGGMFLWGANDLITIFVAPMQIPFCLQYIIFVSLSISNFTESLSPFTFDSKTYVTI